MNQTSLEHCPEIFERVPWTEREPEGPGDEWEGKMLPGDIQWGIAHSRLPRG